MLYFARYSWLLIFALSIFGCVEGQFTGAKYPPSKPEAGSRSSISNNVQCYESRKLKIFQVIDHGILARICPTEYPSYYRNEFEACLTEGELVYMSVKANENDFVDDQQVTLASNQCFIPDGVFSYTTSKDIPKRVRKIRIANI